jgi:hypothetical protein
VCLESGVEGAGALSGVYGGGGGVAEGNSLVVVVGGRVFGSAVGNLSAGRAVWGGHGTSGRSHSTSGDGDRGLGARAPRILGLLTGSARTGALPAFSGHGW